MIIAVGLLLGLLGTAPAHAACGYYVVAGNPSETMAASAQVHAGSATTPSDCPCKGPACRAGDPTPATAAVPISSSGDQTAFFSDCQLPPQASMALGFSPKTPAQPSEVYLPLLDPPPRGSSFQV